MDPGVLSQNHGPIPIDEGAPGQRVDDVRIKLAIHTRVLLVDARGADAGVFLQNVLPFDTGEIDAKGAIAPAAIFAEDHRRSPGVDQVIRHLAIIEQLMGFFSGVALGDAAEIDLAFPQALNRAGARIKDERRGIDLRELGLNLLIAGDARNERDPRRGEILPAIIDVEKIFFPEVAQPADQRIEIARGRRLHVVGELQ